MAANLKVLGRWSVANAAKYGAALGAIYKILMVSAFSWLSDPIDYILDLLFHRFVIGAIICTALGGALLFAGIAWFRNWIVFR